MVTIRPIEFEVLTPQQRWKETQRWMRRFREFHRTNDNLPSRYAYMLARESTRDGKIGRGEHVHWLINTNDRLDVVRGYFKARFTTSDYEIKVDPRDRRLVYLEDGKVGDASTYLMKACHQHVWHRDKTIPHRPSGPVFGPRILWSTNINAIQPLHRIDPKTRRDRVEQRLKIDREAA
ncbi:hypothetical protein IPV08_23945 [Methylobacterium sp. SD274]|uniref:hypothetical protein n=1 Tax=Methylobacterium sp. SD274 TaxID=2782009 RepID=UPI001A9769E2|nr:hypothetical protein [Methylobacterium sp. SD274]MBO1023012.1 hypothetical protein [Methylobacterium sp. SD274]